jgi:hypothetical protein
MANDAATIQAVQTISGTSTQVAPVWSRRELIILALMERLETPPTGISKPANLEVHRYRLRPLEEDNLPALVVYWVACDPTEKHFIASPSMDRLCEYVLSVRVEIRAIGDPVDQAIDSCVKYLRQCVFFDPSFSGLAIGTREGTIRADGEDRGQSYASGTMDFDIAFCEEFYTPAEFQLGGVIHRLDFEQLHADEPGIDLLTVEDPTP